MRGLFPFCRFPTRFHIRQRFEGFDVLDYDEVGLCFDETGDRYAEEVRFGNPIVTWWVRHEEAEVWEAWVKVCDVERWWHQQRQRRVGLRRVCSVEQQR